MKFWKKKEKSVETKEKLSKQGFSYRITICDPWGDSPREVDKFGAKKTRDSDGVVWLTNDDKGFKEIFPLDSDFNTRYSKDQLDKEIQKILNTKIKPNENKLNRESKLLELKKLKKTLDNPKGSFIKIDADGVPHLTYVRYKTSFIPMKWNLDMAYIHSPSEPLIKNVLTVHVDKMKKYNQTKENWITGGMVVFMFILVAWSGVLGYFTLKMYDKADESQIADLQERIDLCGLKAAEFYTSAGENFLETSVLQLNVTKTIFEKINPKIETPPQVTGLE